MCFRAKELETGKEVAIKIIENLAENIREVSSALDLSQDKMINNQHHLMVTVMILSTKTREVANNITFMMIKVISILMIMIYTDDSNAQVMQEYQILSDHSLHPNIPVLFGAFRSFVTPTMIVKMI